MLEKNWIIYSHNDTISTHFSCPYCKQGYLYLDRYNNIIQNSSKPSSTSGFLQCNNCGKEASFIGEIKRGYITYYDEEYGEIELEEDLLYFNYFIKPPIQIPIDNEYPNKIKELLEESFYLYYNHKLICINVLKTIFQLSINDLYQQQNINNNNNLDDKIKKLTQENTYIKIKEDLLIFQFLYEGIIDNLDTIYKALEKILIFIYKKEYNFFQKKHIFITEGKTDWKHLKKALERFQDRREYLDLIVEFDEYENRGSGEVFLKQYIKSHATKSQTKKHICIFDRDTPKYVKEYGNREFIHIIDKDYTNRLIEKIEKSYSDKTAPKYQDIIEKLNNSSYRELDEVFQEILTGKDYKEWQKLSNSNVYAFCIPEIQDSDSPRRLDKICIEFYYKEKDLKTTDSNGKRLFFADEFEFNKKCNGDSSKRFISKCGKFKTESYQVKNGARAELTLISSAVYSIDDEKCKKNLLLSKNDFTNHILNDVKGFDNFDIENFRLIFDVIKRIVYA